ncbi:Oligopeptide transport ATP-binding protein OppF [Microbacterium azadirachtae]|uniref:Oligopeptide transport ATP-binding protein OppF n=1 Tax=Microbacterium azadirachtae TaxID=582680 RepID=A0A0F0L0F6_9MICO|nr:ATP-binding cassette domain-containing protein [Microbacterium azadirachtae]KJL26588.1 Oligopeptide transport ATP-binding protein OppF [Microbacterium azadirachtae]
MNEHSSQVILRADQLTKRFGQTTAVADVSFSLCRGGSLGVVGESGSGKSTTARMVVGLERPTSGRTYFPGTPNARGRDAARVVQMIFQDPYHSFDPRLTIGQAIEEPLRLHFGGAKSERRKRVGELLDQVGLSAKQADAMPRALSGGQRQRAAIARALGIRPQILVLDEAVAALDVSIQAQVLVLLDEIRRETGMAFLFVSHDLAVVRYITQDIIVMRNGRVVESGATEGVLAAPQHPYTRLLLDSVPRKGWDLGRLRADRLALDATEAP